MAGIRVAADGALWVATWGNGVYRCDGSRVEQLSTREGLADDFVRVLSEDVEHNLWVGTRSGGLTRFRTTLLKPVGIPEGLGGNYASAVLGDGADGLWLGTWRSGLFHWRNGVMSPQPLPEQPLDSLINALALSRSHDLWVGTFHGLWRIRERDRNVERVPLPGGEGMVNSLLTARDGTFWLAKARSGLMEFPSGDPRTSLPLQFLPGQNVTSLLEDREGRIWIGAKGGLWRLTAARDRKIERLEKDSVTAAGEDSQGRVWVASDSGKIQVYTRSGPVQLRFTGLPSRAVYLIAADAEASSRPGIWFGTRKGLARASLQEIEEFLAGRVPQVELVAYGVSEGMRTIECRVGAQPSSWMAADGNIWVPTAKGFIEIGPSPAEQLAPPRPWLERVQVDGKILSSDAPIRLSPGTHELAVSFTAIRLGRAERVQFRYRLRGLDQDWVEAGNERTVRYGHLHPGQYALQVSARDPGGAWSEAASTAAIEQLPFLYQTLWFRALVVAAIVGMIGVLYRLRLHAVRRRYAVVLEERNRIAREWHDTLLAGLSAASWQLDVAAEQCVQSPAADSVQSARGMVRYCREEARRAVGDLRQERVDQHEAKPSLGDSLRDALQQLTSRTLVRLRLEIEGKPPECDNELSSDLLRICQEATANALQHARASEVVVRLDCSNGFISLSVQDDGIGMDADSIEHPPHGHYGLLGMRERAQRFGGKIYLSSQPGQGTVVKAVVPLDS